MTRLAASPLKGVFILEGQSRDLRQGEIRREALQGALITTSLVLGIPVLRALRPEETAHLMVYAGRQVERISAGASRGPASGRRARANSSFISCKVFPEWAPPGRHVCWGVSAVSKTYCMRGWKISRR